MPPENLFGFRVARQVGNVFGRQLNPERALEFRHQRDVRDRIPPERPESDLAGVGCGRAKCILETILELLVFGQCFLQCTVKL